jgi:hypothetical protein
MTDKDGLVAKARRQLVAFALFVWISVGFINSLIEQGTKIVDNVRPAWGILGPALGYTGIIALYSTVFACLITVGLLGTGPLLREGLIRGTIPGTRWLLVGLGVAQILWQLWSIESGDRFTPQTVAFFEPIGGLIVLLALYLVYSYLRERWFTNNGK